MLLYDNGRIQEVSGGVLEVREDTGQLATSRAEPGETVVQPRSFYVAMVRMNARVAVSVVRRVETREEGEKYIETAFRKARDLGGYANMSGWEQEWERS